MLFDPEALHNKALFLDAILKKQDLLEKVISRHLLKPFRYILLPRVWEPGGGATLFRIESSEGPLLLKVKHRSVYVESRLESEPAFPRKPSLQNEYDFLCLLSGESSVRPVFFDEEESLQFLAVEWLEPFHAAVQTMTAVQLLGVWQKIVDAVKTLYETDIVHTDVHEQNICFRDDAPVLVDFEEARSLRQGVAFGDSLDVAGANKFGSVGEFPSTEGSIDGLTCLQRLRKVFKSLIRKQLPRLIEEANFDNSCPYNLDEFQEPDPRVYQSLDFPGFRVEGQRPERDLRQLFFGYLLCKSAREEGAISHVDLGSNLGVFCFEAVSYPFVNASLGLEAFQRYVDIANILAFLYDLSRTRFAAFICGENSIRDESNGANFITMFSVYHHIAEKDIFLRELKELGAKYLLAEFATQDRYYPQRGGLLHELDHIESAAGYTKRYLLALSQDYQRPIILFTNQSLTFFDRLFIRIANSRLSSIGWTVLSLLRQVAIFRARHKQYG
jgi:tRNA A-37 threonylcarbamoyl transferase component Bud32